eukprot:CAMPEP_0174897216 /NCGR_PEP_ID=MMETSP0167-20121228/12251_1 /TAXON_ID=38298 /ORGANISM="Rhodella maculata, Strain CCMP736" /LENGTH=35 /DNA_ID= /DNA_START= /DNA_END= /DNA_ORIENTATION=
MNWPKISGCGAGFKIMAPEVGAETHRAAGRLPRRG